VADAAKARPRCADCGLTFVLGERALNDLGEPSRLHHEPGVCAERLLVLVDDVRERAARDRARLRAEINETLAERDQARHDFTAALVVVRAAEDLIAQEDAQSPTERYSLDTTALRAHVAEFRKGRPL